MAPLTRGFVAVFAMVGERNYDLPPSAPSAPKPPSSRGQLTPDDVYALGSTPAILASVSALNSTSAVANSSSTGTPAWVTPYAVTFSLAVLLVIGAGIALHVWKRWKTPAEQSATTESSTSETEMV
jgi:hypothetical protein